LSGARTTRGGAACFPELTLACTARAQVIERLLIEKKNALCLMPTGGGKSLCFQVPALVRPTLSNSYAGC